MSSVRLSERVHTAALSGAATIDEDAGVVRNAAICGLVSENGRDYPLDVQRRDHAKYDGAKVFFDHTDERTGRRFHDWVGVVRAPTCVASGSRGDLELFKTDPQVPKLLEALRKCPEKFGMSHVAVCKTRREKGREVVEAIERVESVDIVLNPATNPDGFFRHESKGRRAVGLTVKALCESLVRHPKVAALRVVPLKTLAEMDGMGDAMTAMDAAPADDADPAAGVSAAFKAAIMQIVEAAMSGDHDPKEALSKIKKLLASHGEVNGTGTADPEPADPEPPAESRRPTGDAILEAIDVCATAGFTGYTREDLEIVAAAPADRRPKLAERLKGSTRVAEAERPVSAPRDRRPPAEAPALETTSEGIKKRWTTK